MSKYKFVYLVEEYKPRETNWVPLLRGKHESKEAAINHMLCSNSTAPALRVVKVRKYGGAVLSLVKMLGDVPPLFSRNGAETPWKNSGKRKEIPA